MTLDDAHEEIETLYSTSVDHIHCDRLHRFIDEQQDKINELQSELEELGRF